MARIPKLTHLQFLILGILRGERKSGKSVRNQLQRRGIRKSGPAFYQLMARLEDVGFVRGWYEQEIVNGQIIRERNYEITAAGLRAWQASCEFYVSVIEQFGDDAAPA